MDRDEWIRIPPRAPRLPRKRMRTDRTVAWWLLGCAFFWLCLWLVLR